MRHTDTGDVSSTLASILSARGATTFAVPSELPDEWRPPTSIVGDALTPLELGAIDGVVTCCTFAIAATGTIVMTSGPSEGPRKLTLVPDLHVCMVQSDQIVETVPEGIDGVADLVRDERRPVTLISGPSATSDIELSRVEGVHGPDSWSFSSVAT
ncbi:MAG: lactate utilization protein C [Gaiellaceae bacterium]